MDICPSPIACSCQYCTYNIINFVYTVNRPGLLQLTQSLVDFFPYVRGYLDNVLKAFLTFFFGYRTQLQYTTAGTLQKFTTHMHTQTRKLTHTHTHTLQETYCRIMIQCLLWPRCSSRCKTPLCIIPSGWFPVYIPAWPG